MNKTISQLRMETKRIIETVLKGKEVFITNRGKVCAKIIPFNGDMKTVSHDEIFGLWKGHDNIKNPSLYVHMLRK